MHIILETPRLILRQFTEDDVDNLFDLNSDPEVMRYLTGGRSTPREEIRDRVIPFHLAVYGRLDRLGTWAAESAATGEFLGWFHFRPGPDGDTANIDLGYRLRRTAWNRGYATEGSRALISMGFTDLGIERVFAHTMAVNTASRRVMEKCGLTLVRTTPYEGAYPIEGSGHGEVEYALTKPEWESRSAGNARNYRGLQELRCRGLACLSTLDVATGSWRGFSSARPGQSPPAAGDAPPATPAGSCGDNGRGLPDGNRACAAHRGLVWPFRLAR